MSIEPFIVIPVVYGLKQLDLNDENTLFRLRAFFFGIHLLLLVAYALIGLRIRSANNNTKVSAVREPSFVEKINGKTTSEKYTATTREYDTEALQGQVKKLLFALTIGCVLHFHFGLAPPLAVQSVLNAMGLFKHPLFRCHILGNNVDRPFPSQNPTALPESQSDAAAETPEAESQTLSQPKSQSRSVASSQGAQEEKETAAAERDVSLSQGSESSETSAARKRINRRKD